MADKHSVSIGWIIFWLIVFFPVGVILVLLRVFQTVVNIAHDTKPFINSTTQEPWTKILPNEPKDKTITCKGCGARTLIENGKAKECEYCGSFIK